MYSLNLAEDGRILSACVCIVGQTYNNIIDTMPDGDITDYKYIDGSYVYDPLPKPEPEPEPDPEEYATYDEIAIAIREGINSYGK